MRVEFRQLAAGETEAGGGPGNVQLCLGRPLEPSMRTWEYKRTLRANPNSHLPPGLPL